MKQSHVSAALSAALLVFPHVLGFDPTLRAASSDVVISQIYGGGGNAGATLRNDFIELFNRGSVAVNVTGWSVQYASSAGTTWQKTDLSGTIQPGQYYLVQEAQGAGGSVNLPGPDAIGTIAMSAMSGKVALFTNLAAVKDFVGYGSSANQFEGTGPTATLSNTTAALRRDLGCIDTDDNAADFAAAAPAPRNTASPLHPCSLLPFLTISDVTVSEGDSGDTAAHFTVSLSAPAPSGGVTFDIATADDTATGGNDYQPTSLTGQTIAAGQQTYSFAVVVFGDIDVEANERFFVNVTNVTGATVSGGQAAGMISNDDASPPVDTQVVISQVYGGGGNAGATFRNDFVELFNRGTRTVDLAGWSVQYNSATGTGMWQTTPLPGSIPPGGYYLVQEAQGAGGTTPLPSPDASGTIPLAATAGKVALRTTATPFTGRCPSGVTVIDLVGYGASNCYEGAAPAAATSNTTAALRKRGGCFESDNNSVDYSIGLPGPRNSAGPVRRCAFTTAAIHEIQGAGVASPFLGLDVITDGIVTGRKINGFFLQTPDASVDADPGTSEGIFVFTSSAPAVAVGDAVTVRGTATEFFSLTQIESTLPGDVTVNFAGSALPAAVVLTTSILDANGALDQLERFEGMRMHAGAVISVGPTNNFGETAAVLAGVARPMREPGIEISQPVPPDPSSGAADCCIPRFDENPERIVVDSDGLAGLSNVSVTSNVMLSDLTGPLDFTFGHYKLLPETPPAASANMSAIPLPAPLTGEFTVAGFNIENFSNTPTQRTKAALAIRQVMRSPDVIGHIEILNLAALQALAAQVNGDAMTAGEPDPAYQALLIPAPLGGTQNVGFLVKTSRVSFDGVTQELAADTYVNPVNGQVETLFDRPPLVLRATVDPSGPQPRQVIVIVNHLRSFIDIERVDSEGARVRAKRTAQAESTARLLQELQTANPGTAVISVGDYNAYQFNDGYTDPVAVLKGTPTPDNEVVVDESPDLVNPDFVNLTDTLPPAERYSFVFDGTPQALDHILVNTVARSSVHRYAIARTNADFPETPASLFAGDVARPERSSDHDAPVAYFCFPPVIVNASVDQPVLSPPNHRMVGMTVDYSAPDTCGAVHTALSVTSDEPVNGTGDGDSAPDWEIVDAHHVRLRAERAGTGAGRVYTITITVTDAAGGTSSQAVKVTVPRGNR